MKKILLSLLFLSFFGCQDQSGIVYVPYDPNPGGPVYPGTGGGIVKSTAVDLSQFRTVSASSINYSFNESQVFMNRVTTSASFNYESLIRTQLTKLNVDFNISYLNIPSMAKQIASNNLVKTYTGTSFALASQFPEITRYYTNAQMNYLNTYFNNMYNAIDAATATAYYNSVKTNVNNNVGFSTQQKIAVIGCIEYANQFAQAFFAGDSQYIYTDVLTTTSQASKTCKIDFKSVWRSGVETAIAGLVTGAYAGASGGTVILPGGGTVTGAVGVGMVGFAGGFIGGSVGSIVSQTFWGCLMNSPQQQPSELCMDFNYALAHADNCFNPVYDRKLIFAVGI